MMMLRKLFCSRANEYIIDPERCSLNDTRSPVIDKLNTALTFDVDKDVPNII